MIKVKETDLQKTIKDALTYAGHKIFRINVAKGRTKDGRFLSTGVPPGYPDLSGCRGDNGKAVFIEVKVGRNKVSLAQARMLLDLLHAGANAGVAYSVEDAFAIVNMDDECYQRMEEYLYDELERLEHG